MVLRWKQAISRRERINNTPLTHTWVVTWFPIIVRFIWISAVKVSPAAFQRLKLKLFIAKPSILNPHLLNPNLYLARVFLDPKQNHAYNKPSRSLLNLNSYDLAGSFMIRLTLTLRFSHWVRPKPPPWTRSSGSCWPGQLPPYPQPSLGLTCPSPTNRRHLVGCLQSMKNNQGERRWASMSG